MREVPSTTPGRTRASAGAILRGVPTSRSPRSKTRTETAGCFKKSRRGFPAASGSGSEHEHGYLNFSSAPPRNGGASRSLREDARRARLVGLVRALPERASERQQSGGGCRRGRPLHGGRPSCSRKALMKLHKEQPRISRINTNLDLC